ncbi:KGGVGR-motif variant AAA ATPase [Glycomyces algeriensis]|uniref:AAA domain-containing protein n=1 Tax=Glycomyces algeriensis TaxID=256037 RepID=A0A9W6G4E9_9ACTN|nr:AAA family ATPase [Glycomyces algeriensis]MDA1366954.1 AAA family ATPase [Glycomyces algeriensis]MDR7352660.1 MinD-like ATPase involved in chromosome partitioning or flagellar assembly [Glycomyces algeriensis]GLI40341.1 hypothetical protein GALLR39Z86_01910 [Glycomyces algeriensis]
MADDRTSEQINPPEHLFTWTNIEDHLAALAIVDGWPEWLQSVDPWWDQFQLLVTPGTSYSQVREWLEETFGTGSALGEGEGLRLKLDLPAENDTAGLPVILEYATDSDLPRRLPLFRERFLTKALTKPIVRPEGDQFSGQTQVIAFHSFKGGVGRTLHAVALADEIARKGGRVLLVDADLAAPGITRMHRNQGRQIDFTYEDFIALLHGSEDGTAQTAVKTAIQFLPNQSIGRYAVPGEITILPTSQRLLLTPPAIEPSDLLTDSSRSPYYLTESLAELAIGFECETVIIDLRAGISELSAPILLDPRVQRVFVTTLADQSLSGTCELIQQLGFRAPTQSTSIGEHNGDPASSVIVTQYRPNDHQKRFDLASEQLQEALSSTLNGSPDPADTIILPQVLASPFREELLALPPTWESVLQTLRICGVDSVVSELAPTRAILDSPEHEPPTPVTIDDRRKRLEQAANEMVYAEAKGIPSNSDYMLTEPLRQLFINHKTDLPIVLVTGPKGSGKTFLFSQACGSRTWIEFAEKSGIRVSRQAHVVPVLAPQQLDDKGLTPEQLRLDFAQRAGIAGTDVPVDIRQRLKQGLQSVGPDDEVEWRRFWLEVIAVSVGLPPSDDPASDLLRMSQDNSVLFIIDGLEEVFLTSRSESAPVALKVLFTDVVEWFRKLRGHPLGLIVLTRRDLVPWAIRQNSAQLLDRYRSYELEWDQDQALRLALWVAARAGSLLQPLEEAAVSDLDYEEVINLLTQVWGWKMGSEKSRQGRSHMWVPAALGDCQGQVQARDVVAFLGEAAKLSQQQRSSWEDRLLAPVAMRDALKACSEIKINAINEEDPDTGNLLDRLKKLNGKVSAPFTLEEVGLQSHEADRLIDQGALESYKGGYVLPEIYRQGLGIPMKQRPRVLRG